jgi:processive 1,2-diacylglycerol beta-glucosyltransferase
MRARLLILTASYGEGHNAAARALAAACDDLHGPGTARVVDVFALANPRLNRIGRRAYIGLINRAPKLWSRIYAWIDRSNIVPRCLWLLGSERRVLAKIIAEENPAVLCSTYPVYAFLLARLDADGHALPPHFNVVTDSISINSLWWRAGAAGWFVPNADSAEVMLRGGVAKDDLHVTGFPVPAFFGLNAARLSPPDLTAPGAAPRVLYIINSGTHQAAETARLLIEEGSWEITIAVGRDELLRRELNFLAAGRARPVTILGWTDQIPHLLMTHHVVISKAGGATTQEAIAARCPMIVNQVVPGQEEGNYELLRRAGSGALATTPAAVLTTLREAFANHGVVWRRWRAGLAPIVRNDAARTIAQHLLPESSITLAERSPQLAAVTAP